MDKKKLLLPISILLGCVILGVAYFNYEIKRREEVDRQAKIDSKKRLIELTITREKFYWRCFSEKVIGLEYAWSRSDEYKKAKQELPPCSSEPRSDGGINFVKMFGCPGPSRPWQEHNEIASKYCSEKADNTQAGLLINEFRSKVPLEIITDDELRDIANNKWN